MIYLSKYKPHVSHHDEWTASKPPRLILTMNTQNKAMHTEVCAANASILLDRGSHKILKRVQFHIVLSCIQAQWGQPSTTVLYTQKSHVGK